MSVELPVVEITHKVSELLNERLEFGLPRKQNLNKKKEPKFIIRIKEIFSQFSLIH